MSSSAKQAFACLPKSRSATRRFARAVVATGARAFLPPIPGLAEAGYRTNETILNLESLPERLLVVGAEPIGCEPAQAFARFGSRVTLVDIAGRALPREDPTAATAGKLTLGALANVIHPYPARAEALRKAGDAWSRRRLTPRTRRWLARLLRLVR